MTIPHSSATKFLSWLVATWLSVLLAGCGGVRLVADYDDLAVQDLADTSTLVFTFYDKLIEGQAATGTIPYQPYAEDWGKVETRLRVRLLREQARPTNPESIEIVSSTLAMWIRFREDHRRHGDYSSAKISIDRRHMARNLGAAMNAEKAKQLGGNAEVPPAE